MNKYSGAALFFIILTALSTVAIHPAKAATDSWVSKAPMNVARGSLGVAVVDGKIYAIGGRSEDTIDNSTKTFGINEEYNPATDTWVFKSPMPTPRSTFAIAVSQNRIYCIGGYNENGGFLTINEVYDPATDSWENKTPAPEGGPLSAVVDGKIYGVSFGGTNVLHLWVYDPETDSWSQKAPVPITYDDGFISASATMTALRGKIYFLGGVSKFTYASLPTYIYDPKTDSWTKSGSYPPYPGLNLPKATATTGVFAPEQMYVIGPIDRAKTIQGLFPFQVFNPSQDNWTIGASMPTGRVDFGLANLDDTLFAIGGYNVSISQYEPGGFYNSGVPSNASSANEQYMPTGYVAPTPSPSPSPTPTQSPTQTPSPTPSSAPSPSIPEFQSWIILPVVTATAILTVWIFRRKKQAW